MTIATIISIRGQAWARDEDGNLRELRVGDTLQEGETLVTSTNGQVQLDFNDNLDPTVIEGGQVVAMTPDLSAEQPMTAEDASVQDADLEALLTALDEGEGDLLAELDATAAGAGAGGAEGGGHDFVRLARITESTDPLAFQFSTADLSGATFEEGTPEPIAGTVSGTVTFELFSGGVNVGGESVVEGNSFTLVVTLDTAPVASPLVITLSNGQQITIPIGATSGQIVLDSRVDDFFVQGEESLGLSVTGATGGGFDELTVGDVPSLTVVDDTDTTTISLEAPEQVTEAEEITVTATVNNAPETDLTITLSNGEQIVIAAGATEGSVTFASRDDDLFQQGSSSQTFSIDSTSGGNYEDLDTSAEVTTTMVDDNDVTLVSLAGPTSVIEGDVTGDYTVSVDQAPSEDLTVTFSYSGVAQNGTDFIGVASVTMPAGSNSTTFNIATLDDNLSEGDELYTVAIDSVSGGGFELLQADPDANSVQTTIEDNFTAPTISINDVTVTEGNTANLTVSLSAATGQPVTVQFNSADGTAVSGADYDATTGTLTFAAGQTSTTVQVQTLADNLQEGSETLTVNLSNPSSNATIADGSGQVTISDDFTVPSISINDVTVTEGNTANLTVSLSAATGQPVTVQFNSADGTAVSGADYDATTGTLTFAAGQTTTTVQVQTLADNLQEGSETLTVNLSNPSSNATIADGSGQVTISDGFTVPSISINDVTVTEGNTANLTVSLSAATGQPVTVQFNSADGTAVSGADYDATTGTLTFAAGQTTTTVQVQTLADNLQEGSETLTVNLSNPSSNATIADGSGQVTISDDFTVPSISINDVTVTEGNTANLTVSLSAATGQPVTVQFNSADGTAVSGADYDATTGTLTFAAGQTSTTVQVQTLADNLQEGSETLTVNLSNPSSNATIADGSGQVTISDDFTVPSISINDVTVTEGNTANLTVSLSAATGQPVTVQFNSADGTAVSGADYDATTGTLTFAAGQTTTTVQVQTLADNLQEGSETLTVNLSNPSSNATIADGSGQVTISDGFTVPSISINDVTVTEGNTANLTVSLSAATGQPVTVQFNSADGTAVSGADYDATTGTLTFAAGQTTTTVQVQTLADNLQEGSETLTVNLSNPSSNATIADGSGQVTISDDFTVPSISINDVTVTEGNTANLTVSLSAATGQPVTVQFNSADGTAVSGADYDATTGTLTFAAGQTSTTVQVQTLADNLQEGSETLTVNLSNPSSNATIADGSGQVTISDDFTVPSISINDVTVTEGNTANLTVSLSAATGQPVTVQFNSADGTAVSGADYDATTGTLTFAAGQTSTTVQVQTLADNLQEGSETLTVNLSNPSSNATIADGSGQVTISDGFTVPSISINDVTVTEGNTANLTVSLSAATGQPVTVQFNSADGTAVSGADYDATTGTLTFAAGQTSTTVQVQTLADNLQEGSETLTVNLSNPSSNATIADGSGQVTIIDGLFASDLSLIVNEAALDTLLDGDDLVVGTVTGTLGTSSDDETDTGGISASGGVGPYTYALQSGGNAVTSGTYGSIQLVSDGSFVYTLLNP